MMTEESGLKAAAKTSKEAAGIYADWLEDNGRILDAAKMRVKAGISVLRFIVCEVATDNMLTKEYKIQSAAMARYNQFCKFNQWRNTNPRKQEELYIKVLEYRKNEVGKIFPHKDKTIIE